MQAVGRGGELQTIKPCRFLVLYNDPFFLRLSKTSLIKHKWHKTEEKSEFLRAPSNLSGIGITGLGMSHVFDEDITITDFNIKR